MEEPLRTKGNAGVLLAHILALLIGEEHVGRQPALRGVGVWRHVSKSQAAVGQTRG